MNDAMPIPTVCQCSHDRDYHGNADGQTGWQARCGHPDCDCEDYLPDCAVCWECPFSDGIPTCDPSRARCPDPPLSAEEQERISTFYAVRRNVWLVYPGDAK